MASYGVFADYYDKLTENVEYEKRAQYLCSLLKAYGIDNGIVLDLACGTGSMTIELSKLGYEMIGVDGSIDMLNVAKRKSDENNEDIMWICQNMQDLDLYGSVDAVICTLDSINHLPDISDVGKTFKRVSRFLNTGGIFIFDVNTQYKHKNVLANNTFVYDTDDVYCVWQNYYNEDDSSVDIYLDFFERKNDAYFRSSEDFTEYYYTKDELEKALKSNDMKLLSVYEELSDKAVSEKTERAFYIAEKI